MTDQEKKTDFYWRLKGKKNGGHLEDWALREVYTDNNELLGRLCYGWKYGGVWRTSAVVDIHDIPGDYKILETRNSYYTLSKEEATESQREILFGAAYG